MFKKWIFYSIMVVLLGITIYLCVLGYSKHKVNVCCLESKVKTFDSDMQIYSRLMEKNKYDINVGKIEGPDFAVEKASEILVKEFGDVVEKYKPYEAHYDEKYERWLVIRSIGKRQKGISPGVIFDADGNVLALWLAK